MFHAWHKLIAEAMLASKRNQQEVAEQAIEDAEFIAWTGRLPTHDFADGMYLEWCKNSARLAYAACASDIANANVEFIKALTELPTPKLLKLKKDLVNIPITDKECEIAQEMLALCESELARRS